MAKQKKESKREQKTQQIPKSHQILKNISMKFDDFIEEYQNVDITQCINDETRQLNMKKLMKLLQKNFNLSFVNKQIKFFYEIGQLWLNCPKLRMNISEVDYLPFGVIRLTALTQRQYIDAIMDQSNSDSDSDSNSGEQIDGQQKCRRLKQRKIKHVIQKVLHWRQLYAGIGSRQKVALQQGAKMVGISKKTLDDYLSQIKKGKKYGFNFNQHKNQKIGVLRQFIRKTEKSKK